MQKDRVFGFGDTTFAQLVVYPDISAQQKAGM